MKRRIVVSTEEIYDCPLAVRSRHRRYGVFLITFAATVLTVFGLVLYSATKIASTLSPEVLASATWLTTPENGLEWQNALHQQTLESTPSPHNLAFQQVLFISCNRHDRSQAYWANIAVAAQCELLSRRDRAAAAPCRRLYAGQSPLSLSGAALAEEETWVKEPHTLTSPLEVPLGACGSVLDSTAAAQHRATIPLSGADEKADTARSPAALRFPLSPLKADPVPLDAVLWLGDAIYADKRADGHDGQSLLSQHVNSLAEVGRFWQTQRDAPEYNAFISSCVASASPADEAPPKPSVRALKLVAEQKHFTELLAERGGENNLTATPTPARARVDTLSAVARDDRLVVPQPPTAATPQHNVWGTWDDHDMGKNDGGKEYPHKNVTQRFFLDFLKAPASDPRWSREGVYEAYTLPFHAVVDNSKGWGSSLEALLRQLYEHAMCVILLDVRTFRDPPNASYAGDMLGAGQWDWFETQLQSFTTRTSDGREPCAVTLIGSGVQFILDEKPAENWAAFPTSRDRLLGLLRHYKAERVAFLTGDIHMGELGADFTAQAITQALGYPLLEATSSGLTHSANMFFLPTLIPRLFPTPRRLAVYVEKNFGAARLSVDLLHLPQLRTYLNDTKDNLTVASLLQTAEQRQSVRDLVQDAINLTFTIFSIAQHGQPVHRLNFPLSMLTYKVGPTYLEATVDTFHGDVHVRNARNAAATASVTMNSPPRTKIQLRDGTFALVAHYPTTVPTPFVTWYVRTAQHYIFTGSSVSETLKLSIILDVFVALLMAAQAGVWMWRRVSKRRLHPLQRHSTSVSPLQAHSAEFLNDPSALHWWWRKVFGIFQKDKTH